MRQPTAASAGLQRVSSAHECSRLLPPATGGVLIVGGGLVGASLAIALDAAGIAATLVEAGPPRADAQPSYDERNLALARASVNGLRAIGVWPHAEARRHADPAYPRQSRRRIRQRAAGCGQHGVDALGWTLPARELGAALARRLDECRRLTRLAPATWQSLEPMDGGWRAAVQTGRRRAARWRRRCVVGADGTESFVRERLGIEAERHDYRPEPVRLHGHARARSCRSRIRALHR